MFGNRSPAPFPPIATGDTKLDGLLGELVALPYGNKTDARRATLRKAIGERRRDDDRRDHRQREPAHLATVSLRRRPTADGDAR